MGCTKSKPECTVERKRRESGAEISPLERRPSGNSQSGSSQPGIPALFATGRRPPPPSASRKEEDNLQKELDQLKGCEVSVGEYCAEPLVNRAALATVLAEDLCGQGLWDSQTSQEKSASRTKEVSSASVQLWQAAIDDAKRNITLLAEDDSDDSDWGATKGTAENPHTDRTLSQADTVTPSAAELEAEKHKEMQHKQQPLSPQDDFCSGRSSNITCVGLMHGFGLGAALEVSASPTGGHQSPDSGVADIGFFPILTEAADCCKK